jgi:fido (protein-threonine AMPylation protein)
MTYGNAKKRKTRRTKRQASEMAKTTRYTGKGGYRASKSAAGAGRPVDVVRERTGEYGPPQDAPEEEKNGEAVGSTRLFETAEGRLTYPQLSERLAVALADILNEIVQAPPDQIVITPEWICLLHRSLAGSLFPDWAGRYRDVNVQVSGHTPPAFYEVPGLMRLFCDDLAERLRHIRLHESAIDALAELLAWADWRFQWIHPFKDFNGRIGRVLLAALLYKLSLPPLETAPSNADSRRHYLEGLHAADSGDLGPLTDLWLGRIAEAL